MVFLVIQGRNPKFPSIRKIDKILAVCATPEAAQRVMDERPRTVTWVQKMPLTGE